MWVIGGESSVYHSRSVIQSEGGCTISISAPGTTGVGEGSTENHIPALMLLLAHSTCHFLLDFIILLAKSGHMFMHDYKGWEV